MCSIIKPQIFKENDMRYQPEIIARSIQPALTIRTTSSVEELPGKLGQAYAAIIQYLGELGEQPAGAPFAAYFNMDMQNLVVDVGFPVSRELPARGNIHPSQIPEGRYGSLIYTGPYKDCASAYEALTEFLEGGEHKASGVVYEMYLNDPAITPEMDLRTLILFPLK
jgi:effector-binding domain-containing protein